MYKARITRHNPAAIVVLVDQSGSMSEQTTLYGAQTTKAHAVASIVDMMIAELLMRCKCEGSYRDYFDIAILSYGGDGVHSLLTDEPSKPFVSPSSLSQSYIDAIPVSKERLLPSGKSVISTVERKVWIAPVANGDTPMYEGLNSAYNVLSSWIARHRDSFPPMLFNITDGEASDASDTELRDIAQRLKELSTTDGSLLLFNIHISATTTVSSVMFPADSSELSESKYAKLLYDMSSTLPSIYNDYINSLSGRSDDRPLRCCSFNTDMNKLMGILNIGSASINIL